jgi:hypothetical protein
MKQVLKNPFEIKMKPIEESDSQRILKESQSYTKITGIQQLINLLQEQINGKKTVDVIIANANITNQHLYLLCCYAKVIIVYVKENVLFGVKSQDFREVCIPFETKLTGYYSLQ